MARIQKRGLDYFPMDTDFIHNRLVRRIMKREGDGAFAILTGTLSAIFAEQGYYVLADDLFYDDLATRLFEKTADDVKRTLALAVEYGLFDARLFREHGILTSVEIQRQYLFSTKRRKNTGLDERYSLVEDDNQEDKPEETPVMKKQEEIQNVTFTPENVTSGTQSIAKQSKENPLLQSSPETGGTGEDANPEGSAEEEYLRKIDALQPPQDGTRRNLEGLKFNLRQFRIPLREQYAIILHSNFGAIGHPLWKGFFALRESHGKIRQPGRYLLSLCVKQQT